MTGRLETAAYMGGLPGSSEVSMARGYSEVAVERTAGFAFLG